MTTTRFSVLPLLFLLLLVAQGAMAASMDVDDYKVVVRYMHKNALSNKAPNCAQHEKKIAAKIKAATPKPSKSSHRELGLKYNNPHCNDMCKNVVKGYCFLISGGICDDATLRTHMRRNLAAASTVTLQDRCDKKSAIVKSEIQKYGQALKGNDKCRSYFLATKNWKTDCFFLEN